MAKIRLLGDEPIRIGRRDARPAPVRTWGRPVPAATSAHSLPTSQLDRTASYAGAALKAGSVIGQISAMQWWRILSAWQIDLIYQRCSDVRACIDGIVRQVATHDWEIGVNIESGDEQYEAAVAACKPIKLWLARPTVNGDTWQEVLTSFLTDLLKHDAGAMERVRNGGGDLVEAAPIRGPDVYPIADTTGRIVRYDQVPFNPLNPSASIGTPVIELSPSQVLYMNLFPTTLGPGGQPLLEALVYEVIAILRSTEYWAHSVDMNELPPGIAVIVGMSHDAAARWEAQFEQENASDWKLRTLVSPDPGTVDAKWVPFNRAARDLQLVELSGEIRRAIWRVFGVQPVEMGDPGGTNRATAEVQIDASASHLIKPILELLAAKVNSHLVAELVPDEFKDIIEFRWVDHNKLTQQERLARAQTLSALVDRGLITRDEARADLGLEPYQDDLGSVPTVVSGAAVIRLEDALTAPLPQAAGGQPPDGGSDGGNDGGSSSGDPSADPAQNGKNAPTGADTRVVFRGHGIRRARSWTAATMPDHWNTSPAARTLDLRALWAELIRYRNDVDALWEETRASVLDAAAAEVRWDDEARARVSGGASAQLAALAASWSLSTLPRYRAVAESARRTAGDWTAWTSGADDVRRTADTFAIVAMGHLSADGGLLADVGAAVRAALVATDRATTGTSVLSGIASAFDAARHRIWNFATRLMELANQIVSDQILSSPGVSDTMMVEWVDDGGPGECDDCAQYASLGFTELATLPTRPGAGATECHGNCRCVLNFAWKSAVYDGTAKLIGHRHQKTPSPNP